MDFWNTTVLFCFFFSLQWTEPLESSAFRFFYSGMVMVDFCCLSYFLGKAVSKSSMSKTSFASFIVTYWQVCHLRVKIKFIQPRLWQPQEQASGQSHHLRFAAGQAVGIHFAFVSLNITAKRKKLWVDYVITIVFFSCSFFLLLSAYYQWRDKSYKTRKSITCNGIAASGLYSFIFKINDKTSNMHALPWSS